METMKKTQSGTKAPLLNRNLLLFMGAMVLANLGGNMYGPLLPLYLKELGANVVQVGLFFTLSQIIPLALQILGGWISDTLGRLRSIAMGSLATLLAYIVLILSPSWEWALLGMGLGAVTTSLVGPSFSAFIAENSSEENRARVFGMTDTIFMVVGVIGPPLGGELAGRYGFKLMLGVATVIYAVATVVRVGMARSAAKGREANPTRLSLAGLKTNMVTMFTLLFAGGVITWVLITDGVRDIAYSLSFNLFPLYLEDVGGLTIQQIGWLNSVFGICMMAVTIPAGWLSDKKGERLNIVAGFLLEFAALMVLIRANDYTGFLASFALFGVGVGMMSPAYSSLISKAVPEKLRGTAFGLFQTSLGLVSLPAPAIGAQLWQRFGPRFPFTITAWISVLVILPAWFKFKLPKNGQAETADEKPKAPGGEEGQV
jgi:MFS family permease